ncbi:hypothetical protein B14911_08360 [Bacillus sp. NRRL B-14911]|uniref:Uncharacterized protein n=1 Tax=Bacillus infantis NRRL B-14911 TaxID=1367477 RepID=U5LFG2_9BACI|nr:hypothetical protein N288_17690 [Bacillus infantis NRRL B-14911]EAR65250.1 hypothetical protein B14911_08360 [Bacillus sp. NRRL B-14911]
MDSLSVRASEPNGQAAEDKQAAIECASEREE